MDSFDLVVVGAFYGMGKRAGKYGACLWRPSIMIREYHGLQTGNV